MHEMAITRSIVGIAKEAAGERLLRAINVDIGTQSGIMADAVAFCFKALASEFGLAEAALNITEIEARGRCAECANEFAMATIYAACPCGSRKITRLSGDELNVRSIEFEELS